MIKNKSQEAEASFTQASDEKTVYEAGFHIVPTVAESKVGEVVERVRAAVEKLGGSIIGEGFPQKVQFAFIIERAVAGKREKYSEGYFGWMKFEAPAAAAKQLEAVLLADRDVLRSIIVRASLEEVAAPKEIFSSNALAGEVIQPKPVVADADAAPVAVSEEELNKTIDSLTA